MATDPMMLPPGFELENAPASSQAGALPAGFELEPPQDNSHWYDALSDSNPIMKSIAHGAGVTGRAVFRGIGDVASTPIALWNLKNHFDPSVSPEQEQAMHLPTISEAMDKGMDAIDLPQPDTPLERMYSSGIEGATGGLGLGGKVGAVPGFTGGVSSAGAKELGFGPGVQLAAGLAGGMIPAAANAGMAAMKAPPATAREIIAQHMRSRPDMGAAIDAGAQAEGQAGRAGIPLTLGETMEDPALIKMQAVLSGEPTTQGKMSAFTDARDDLVPQKVQSLAEALGSAKSSDEASRGIIRLAEEKGKEVTKQLSAQASPLYAEAFDNNKSMSSPEIDRLLATPAGKAAMAQARVNMQNSGKLMGVSSPELTSQAAESDIVTGRGVADGLKMETLHNIKVALDDAYEAAAAEVRPGQPVPAKARAILDVKNGLLDEMDNLDTTKMMPAGRDPATGRFTPSAPHPEGGAYARARKIYSGNPDKLQMRENMGMLADVDPANPRNVPRDIAAQGTTATKTLAQALGDKAPMGAQSLIFDALENQPGINANGIPGAFGVPGKVYGSPAQQERMETLAGPQNAPAIEDTMDTIRRANLSNRYRANSTTSPLEQASENLKTGYSGSGLFKALVAVARGDNKGALMNLMGKIQAGKGFDPEMLQQLQGILTSPDGMALMQELKANPNAYMQPGFSQRLMKELGPRLLGAAMGAQQGVNK